MSLEHVQRRQSRGRRAGSRSRRAQARGRPSTTNICADRIARPRAAQLDAVHRKRARTREPHVVTGALVQLQQRIARTDRAVTQHRELRRGTRTPDEFARFAATAHRVPAEISAIHATTPGAPLQNWTSSGSGSARVEAPTSCGQFTPSEPVNAVRCSVCAMRASASCAPRRRQQVCAAHDCIRVRDESVQRAEPRFRDAVQFVDPHPTAQLLRPRPAVPQRSEMVGEHASTSGDRRCVRAATPPRPSNPRRPTAGRARRRCFSRSSE